MVLGVLYKVQKIGQKVAFSPILPQKGRKTAKMPKMGDFCVFQGSAKQWFLLQ